MYPPIIFFSVQFINIPVLHCNNLTINFLLSKKYWCTLNGGGGGVESIRSGEGLPSTRAVSYFLIGLVLIHILIVDPSFNTPWTSHPSISMSFSSCLLSCSCNQFRKKISPICFLFFFPFEPICKIVRRKPFKEEIKSNCILKRRGGVILLYWWGYS